MKKYRTLATLVWLVLLSGCERTIPGHVVTRSAMVDAAFLTQPLWDDGKAEVAFYQVERYLQADDKKTVLPSLAASILVKHDYDPVRLMKAVGFSQHKVASFQWVFFYPFEDRYATKYSFSVHAVQVNFRPLKQSFASISFEGNGYVELNFLPDSSIAVVNRGDKVSEPEVKLKGRPHAYPVGMVPLLVRAMDFGENRQHDFWVVLLDGKFVQARATHTGVDTLQVAGAKTACEKITVHYSDLGAQSFFGVTGYLAPEETYWRSRAPNRQIVQLESSLIEAGVLGKKVRIHYRMKWIEELRSAYWEEDVRKRLRKVKKLP